jgi:hypothetical protein
LDGEGDICHFLFGSERLPNRALLGLARRPLLRSFARSRFGFEALRVDLVRALLLRQCAAQPDDLGSEFHAGVCRRLRRPEGAGIKLAVPAVTADEPDARLARLLQRAQRLGRRAQVIVHRGIADPAQIMEQLGGLPG